MFDKRKRFFPGRNHILVALRLSRMVQGDLNFSYLDWRFVESLRRNWVEAGLFGYLKRGMMETQHNQTGPPLSSRVEGKKKPIVA
jgi:hypothetical protein